MRIVDIVRILRMFAPAVGRLPAGHLWYLLGRMGNEKPHKFGKQIRVNTFFPPFPSRAFDRFLKAVIQRRRVPYSTYIAITSHCPFHCGHCSYGGESPPTCRSGKCWTSSGRSRRWAARRFGFTGGEPLLVPWLEELVAACSPEMATIVFTTGHGLDAPRAAALARAGLGCLTVGVESSDPASHDRVRGAAGARSFDEARLAVRTALDAGLYTAVSTIGTKEKLATGDLDRLYDLAASWGVGELRVLAPVASGGAAGCQAFMLSPEDRQALRDFHVRRNRANAGPAVASFAYLESAEMFGCGAGYHHLFIDAAGEVCPCDLTPLSMGNACQEPLADIWARMAEHFAKPRTHCLMGSVAALLAQGDATLPLPRETSERILTTMPHDGALPGAYKRLLK